MQMFYLPPFGNLPNSVYLKAIPRFTFSPKRITRVKQREAPKIRGFPIYKEISKGLLDTIAFPEKAEIGRF
jgi:hypothetical protein